MPRIGLFEHSPLLILVELAPNQNPKGQIMKTALKQNLVAAALVGVLTFTSAYAQTVPAKYKMTTDMPPSVITPDKVETRLGTLNFFDGFPDDATVDKVYDNLDFQRGVQAYLTGLPAVAIEAFRRGMANSFGPGNQVAIISDTLLDSKRLA